MRTLYYWMMHYISKVKTNEMPKFNAFLIICAMIYANLGSLFVVLKYLFKIKDSIINKQDTILVGIIIGLMIMILNFFLLYRNKDDIEKSYNQVPIRRKNIDKFIFWVYSLCSFPLFYILLATLNKM